MKTQYYILLFLITFLISCKTSDVKPAVTCTLDKIDRSRGYLHNYTYDAKGKITSKARIFGNQGTCLFTFTYDAAGLLIKSDINLDGAKYSTENYTYTNCLISKVSYKSEDGDAGTNKINYDSKGNLVEFTYQANDKSYFNVQSFEYDSQGLITKRSLKDQLDGPIGLGFFEVRYENLKPEKSPEALLNSKGLPFDLLSGFSWQNYAPGVGSTAESFGLDEESELSSFGLNTITKIVKNGNGYVTEIESKDTGDDAISKAIFSLSNCN
jgi:hypothetical protein